MLICAIQGQLWRIKILSMGQFRDYLNNLRQTNIQPLVGGFGALPATIDPCQWEQIEAAIRQQNGPNSEGWVGITVQTHDFHQSSYRRGSDTHVVNENGVSFMKYSKFYFDRSSG